MSNTNLNEIGDSAYNMSDATILKLKDQALRSTCKIENGWINPRQITHMTIKKIGCLSPNEAELGRTAVHEVTIDFTSRLQKQIQFPSDVEAIAFMDHIRSCW